MSDGHGGTATATATVLVGSTDDAPVASGETVNSQEDQVVTLTAAALLANETDIDNAVSSLSISRVTGGAGGSAVLNASGNVVFTPNANFSGTASFTYWVKDPDGMESNPATVTVNVAAVNDAPYAQGENVSGASEDAVGVDDGFNRRRGLGGHYARSLRVKSGCSPRRICVRRYVIRSAGLGEVSERRDSYSLYLESRVETTKV